MLQFICKFIIKIMSKSNKRESKQTGMTNSRLKGLEMVREQRSNKNRSRLAQAVEVSITY